jgi:3-dehydroquinate synthase
MTTKKKATSHQRVHLNLEKNSYDVLIGNGIVDKLAQLYKADSKRAVLISDQRLTEARKKVIKSLTKGGWSVHEIAVEAGESLKNLEQLYPIYGEMLKAGIDRSSTLFALGGGTVGDAAGFIASTYLRGIAWIGLPTTLLAQVDSSIGGKTAVNHPIGTNLIGSFYQPALVVCDTDFLKTLSQRELISGLGEVVKYGLTFDKKFFSFVRENWGAALKHDPKVMQQLVKQSAVFKAQAVMKDEFDRKGVREVLNFGHTFGHALESVTGYGKFQHGEAVIWGMRFALALSKVKGQLSSKVWQEADGFLSQIKLEPLPLVRPEDFFEVMSKDKKAKEGKVRFILLKSIGKTLLDRNIEPSELLSAFKIMQEVKND